MGPELISYAAAIALAGFLAGGLSGFVVRGARARRQAEVSTAEIKQLRSELENAPKKVVPAQEVVTPKRWTGNEVAAVVGAVAALLGAAGALMGNYQGKEIKDLEAKLLAAETSKNEVSQRQDTLKASMKGLMSYDIKEWTDLRKEEYPLVKRKKPLPVELNNRQVSAPCDAPKSVLLSYAGTRPAILNCKSGKASLILEQPTKILLIPLNSAQSEQMAAKF